MGAFSRQRLTVLEKNGGIDFVKLLPVHPFLPAWLKCYTTGPAWNPAAPGTLKMRDMKMREKDTALTYWTDLDSDCTPAG